MYVCTKVIFFLTPPLPPRVPSLHIPFFCSCKCPTLPLPSSFLFFVFSLLLSNISFLLSHLPPFIIPVAIVVVVVVVASVCGCCLKY